MTRSEFAAGLNAVERVNELVRLVVWSEVSRDDLATLRRLQEEFAADLASLRSREPGSPLGELQVNQFSTTTKLTGQVIFAVNGVASAARALLIPQVL